VGLVPDSEILRCKGPPILSDAERLKLVESVKWVDEVLTDVPYDLTPEFLHELFTKHRIDYVLHGDDPCLLPDGTDAYAHAKKLGRFKMIKRTEGVSTTDIVGRMLMCSRDNARFSAEDKERLTLEFSMGNGDTDSDTEPGTPATSRHTTVSRFMPTSRRIVQARAVWDGFCIAIYIPLLGPPGAASCCEQVGCCIATLLCCILLHCMVCAHLPPHRAGTCCLELGCCIATVLCCILLLHCMVCAHLAPHRARKPAALLGCSTKYDGVAAIKCCLCPPAGQLLHLQHVCIL
jgi:glycerol-3-phosphate cytidylyltransferase-like family protein